MYESYFGLTERPFSIAPDPQYLYMSERHKEAMAHLTYGVREGGGFVQLTGEVGTGKTTLCRSLVSDLPENVDVALILNPRVNEHELLQVICDELKIPTGEGDTAKQLHDKLNQYLLNSFAEGRNTVLIIDEAQLLARDVLEQVRLLTNLETNKAKLLQIILIGQPELNDLLRRTDLRQLAQRITARYHLGALGKDEVSDYVTYRLGVAGGKQALFSRQALAKIYKHSGGIPRLINVLCDRALLAAYGQDKYLVDAAMVDQVAEEVLAREPGVGRLERSKRWWLGAAGTLAAVVLAAGAAWVWLAGDRAPPADATAGVIQQAPAGADAVTPAEPSSSRYDDVLTPGSAEEPPAETPAGPELADPGDAATTASIAEVLADPGLDTGLASAYEDLAYIWGSPIPAGALGAPCEDSESTGLACHYATDGWERIAQLNRPAILFLQDAAGTHHLVLSGMDSDQATLRAGALEFQVSRDELAEYWSGSFLIFWRSPPFVVTTIAEGAEGAGVVWLRRQLANFTDTPRTQEGAADLNPVFDRGLTAEVLRFQQQHGLAADGIVGPETLITLNSLLRRDAVPTLYAVDFDNAG